MKNFSRSFSKLTAMVAFMVLSLFLLSGCAPSVPSTPEEILKVTSQDWVKGSMNAPVTLIEYSDFQCPICAAFHPVLNQLTQKYPEKLRHVYRYFPLIQNHPNAMPAAKAAQAAGLQGKFWEMSDLLFQNQQEWAAATDAQPIFSKYAKQLNLDQEKFLKDFSGNEVENRVRFDLNAAEAMKLEGTPSFFLNGKKLQIRPADFQGYVESVLQEASVGSSDTSQTTQVTK